MHFIPFCVISTISPGSTSRKYRAPIDKKPQLSLEITQPSGFASMAFSIETKFYL